MKSIAQIPSLLRLSADLFIFFILGNLRLLQYVEMSVILPTLYPVELWGSALAHKARTGNTPWTGSSQLQGAHTEI